MQQARESSSPLAREGPSLSTAADDDATIARLLADPTEEGINLDLSQSFGAGEKADNAKDFEDISDDENDLPDEELPGIAAVPPTTEPEPGYEDDPDIDGLFDDGGSSPVMGKGQVENGRMSHTDLEQLQIPTANQHAAQPASAGSATQAQDALYGGDTDSMDDDDPDWLEQKRLFAEASTGGGALPAPPEDEDELLQSLLPRFDPEEPARFQRLLGPMPMQYAWKRPIKPPKAIQLAKLSLELRQDQEKLFRLTAAAAAGRALPDWAEVDGAITISQGGDSTKKDESQIAKLDDIDDNELVGGLSMQDLAVLCADWDIDSTVSASSTPPDMTECSPETGDVAHDVKSLSRKRSVDSFDEGDAELTEALKRLKTAQKPFDGHLPMSYDMFYSLDDPEATNALLSRHVPLDLNDPHMLLDIQAPDAAVFKPKRAGQDFRKEVSGSLTKSMIRKYNISNDDAYELLKENHSSKIRSMIGNLTPEHSMPALKLQFPFYRVKLSARDARTYHRAPIRVHSETNRVIKPTKRDSRKRKDLKILTIQQIFESAKDLSVNDNSDIVMMEYSEEQPMMLSNFGMGNKLINYYRRSDEQDTSRPKFDLGDTSVLLPQDKSPFSIFGNVAPGANQPTLHNAMFRAPVWQHQEKPTDFILGRSTTGIGGNAWFLRKTSNTFIVGQQFPSVEVPGTHSRKVTDAAKRRLKQISFRVYHKFSMNPRRYPALTNDIVREHLPGSDVPQNRGKMREFMQYDKQYSMWKPQEGDVIPDTYAGIRERPDAHIRPEDVALLDAMQVGHQYLKDRGLDKDDILDDDKEADDNEEETEDQLEVKLAPWHASKNFLKACQGQAMLRLHGKGDPTGRQEGYDMVKISMKGGFKAFGESIADTLARQKQNQKSGHSYNVADQQKIYEASIQRTWQAQMASLSADAEHSDVEPDDDDNEVPSNNYSGPGQTPRSGMGTPAASRRGPLDSASVMSHGSSQAFKGRPLRVIRRGKDKYGRDTVTEQLVKDPRVMKLYLQHANRRKRANISLDSAAPTGDASNDALQQQAIQDELARLLRNKERRHAREKAKGKFRPSDTGADGDGGGDGDDGGASGKAAGGTQRKCANCGMVGHIKTNKKLCPLLNGTRQADTFDDSAFGAGPSATPTGGNAGSAFDGSPASTTGGTPAFSP